MTRIFAARVQDGKIVVDGLDLPDGTPVTVAANDERDAECELSVEELAELDAAIAEADGDETVVPHETVLAKLERLTSR